MNTNIYGASNLQFLNSIIPSDINFLKQRIKSLLNESISNADEKVDSDYINDLELLYNDINEIVFNNFIDLGDKLTLFKSPLAPSSPLLQKLSCSVPTKTFFALPKTCSTGSVTVPKGPFLSTTFA